MKQFVFHHLYTALITPFDKKGQLDEEKLKQLLHFQIQSGIKGIVVLGTTGETPTLNAAERKRIIEISRTETAGQAHLIVGTGSYSTEQTIQFTQEAQYMGADAALIVTPYYNKPTQEGIYKHFEAICHATSIPICLYNIQGRTAQNIQTDTVQRIAELPHVVGIKEASGHILQMQDVLAQATSSFKVLSGDDALTLPLMALGGHGVISVASNLVPGPMQSLVNACVTANFTLAREWHYQLLPLFKALFIETNPIPIKEALNLCEMAVGSCRLPLCAMHPDNRFILQQVIQQLPTEWYPYGQTQPTFC